MDERSWWGSSEYVLPRESQFHFYGSNHFRSDHRRAAAAVTFGIAGAHQTNSLLLGVREPRGSPE